MRKSTINRNTNETKISITLNLDEKTIGEISTGIAFFDHMLTAFFKHSSFGGSINACGDIQVDTHHTAEDVGIVLGQAFKEAIGDKKGITRYGSFYCPMDEALGFSAIDISGRSFCVYDCTYTWDKIGELDSDSVGEFFKAFAQNSGVTVHIKSIYGENDHHKCEAIFKAFAHALGEAAKITSDEILSTKGSL